MTWVNPLDYVPQIPQDWANHVIYGGLLGTGLCFLFAHGTALFIVFAISAAKKAADYFLTPQSFALCVGKTLASCVWSASFLWVAA